MLAVMLSVGTYAPAFAFDYGVSTDNSVSAGVGIGAGNSQAKVSAESSTSAEVKGNSQKASSDNSNEGHFSASSTASTTLPGSANADLHRSAVSMFVLNLLKVANREGGIGAEVRTIAQAQNDSASTTAQAMTKVETRSGFKTFLIGSDYKNLGMIRSELAKTANQIERLKVLAGLAVNAQDKAELNAQISLLEADQAKVDAFVTAHENRFSMFGWFVKIFVK